MSEQVLRAFVQLMSRAPFWSLRYVDAREETLAVRNDVAEPPHLRRDRGAMLTAMTQGGYGYAATSDLSAAGLQAALDRATQWAFATQHASAVGFDPARVASPQILRAAPDQRLSIPRKELLDWLHAECTKAKIADAIVDRYFAIEQRDAMQLYLTNHGAHIEQSFHSIVPHGSVSANRAGDTQTRSLDYVQRGGVEILRRSGFFGCGVRLADEALQLLVAPDCPNGKMDLLLMPDQMMLQIHESIGHPLELDRILGDERNYAGTSFVTPDMFGTYRYGSSLLNVTYDPSPPEELASYAFDDEGTPAEKVYLIRNGILERPLGSALSQARANLPGVANARASNWNRAPIDRMANLNVEAGASTLTDMIAGIERGVLMRTNQSWSIDDSRNKFQFGCEWGELIESGRVKNVVKNPNYRGISSTFWRSLCAVGDTASWEIHGTLYCGKGEPNQAIHVGHAAPPCVFSSVDVFGAS